MHFIKSECWLVKQLQFWARTAVRTWENVLGLNSYPTRSFVICCITIPVSFLAISKEMIEISFRREPENISRTSLRDRSLTLLKIVISNWIRNAFLTAAGVIMRKESYKNTFGHFWVTSKSNADNFAQRFTLPQNFSQIFVLSSQIFSAKTTLQLDILLIQSCQRNIFTVLCAVLLKSKS